MEGTTGVEMLERDREKETPSANLAIWNKGYGSDWSETW